MRTKLHRKIPVMDPCSVHAFRCLVSLSLAKGLWTKLAPTPQPTGKLHFFTFCLSPGNVRVSQPETQSVSKEETNEPTRPKRPLAKVNSSSPSMPRLSQSPRVINLSHAHLHSLCIPTSQTRTQGEPIVSQRLAAQLAPTLHLPLQ